MGVFDPNNGPAIGAELGCRVSPSLDDLVASPDIDCVIVASPSYLHVDAVLKAAANKKHVFCEKTIALSYKDCVAMVEACKKNGVLFMAGHIMNFFNGVSHAKKIIEEGKIGKVLYCHAARTGFEEAQDEISWKKYKAKSGGHLYHKGEGFGDEEDLLVLNLEYDNDRYALLEYGNAFRWGEHYLLIQGTKGAIKLDLYNTGGTLRVKGEEESHFLIHESQKEDDERTAIYTGRGMDGAIAYGRPGLRSPRWLLSCIDKEMAYLHKILEGGAIDEEFVKLTNGQAA